MGKLSEFDGAAPEEIVKSCAECNRRVEHPTNAQLSFCGMDEARRVVGTYKESVPDWCYFISKRPPMTDITAPKLVEVQIRHDQKVIWVNVNGTCALRCCQVEHLVLPDDIERDGTDNAHPAWWRGHVDGARGMTARLAEVLDGKDTGAGVLGTPEIEEVRRRMLKLVTEKAEGTLWQAGYDAGIHASVTILRRVLDGGDLGNGVLSSAELEKLRRDLIALKASEQHLIEKEAGENL